MPSTKEIKDRINSIEETHKITNAMYLIASTKLHKAKRELDLSKPYFDSVRSEIKSVLGNIKDVDSPYFRDERSLKKSEEGVCAFLVITADKGLAGPYNQNIIKLTKKMAQEHPHHRLFVVGEYGRQHFISHKIPIENDFIFTAQNPTFHRARKISGRLLELYDSGEIDSLYIIYTDYGTGAQMSASSSCLLPLSRDDFKSEHGLKDEQFEFYTSAQKVIKNIVPSYIEGFVYSALIDSFCCELSSRMTAMDSADRNAEKLLGEIKLQYNHARQGYITQEITEISSCARHQRKGVSK